MTLRSAPAWTRPGRRRPRRTSTRPGSPCSIGSCRPRSAPTWPPATTTTRASARRSSWPGTASGAASTGTSATPSRPRSTSFAGGCTPASSPARTRGPSGSAARRGFRPHSRSSTRGAHATGRPCRPRCCCATAPAISTACTRISTATWCFPCRWRCCSTSRDGTSRVGSWCSWSRGRACSRGRSWSRCGKDRAWCFRAAIGRGPVCAGFTGPRCGTGSASCVGAAPYPGDHLPRGEVVSGPQSSSASSSSLVMPPAWLASPRATSAMRRLRSCSARMRSSTVSFVTMR